MGNLLGRKKSNVGFTLIEVMIAVVIISILMAVAIPAYNGQINRSARANASGALIGLAASMERRFTQNGHYCDSALAAGGTVVADCGGGGQDEGTPAFYQAQTPEQGNADYNLELTDVTRTTFTITATRTGRMTGDDCGDFTYTHTGQRGLTNNTLGMNDCWR